MISWSHSSQCKECDHMLSSLQLRAPFAIETRRKSKCFVTASRPSVVAV